MFAALVAAPVCFLASLGKAQALLLSTLSAVFAFIALAGYMGLGLLALMRYLAPTSAVLAHRPLYFDYAQAVPSVIVPLAPGFRWDPDGVPPSPGQLPGRTPPAASLRLLSAGQAVSVCVSLRLPSYHHELFQVSAELLGLQGQTLARGSRVGMLAGPMPPLAAALSQLAATPLALLGMARQAQDVQLCMFEGYVEAEAVPLGGFRASLSSRGRGGPSEREQPPVIAAEVQVRLQMGALQAALYWMRPSLGVSLLIGLAAGSMAATGTCGALLMALLSHKLRRWSAAHTRPLAGLGPKQAADSSEPLSVASSELGDAPAGCSFPDVAEPGAASSRKLAPWEEPGDGEGREGQEEAVCSTAQLMQHSPAAAGSEAEAELAADGDDSPDIKVEELDQPGSTDVDDESLPSIVRRRGFRLHS